MNFNTGNNMGSNMGSNVKFSFNGQDANGMGIDPSLIFQQFFGQAGGFDGFSRMNGMNREKGGKRSQSNFKGSSKFGNFGGFGGFNQGQPPNGFENFNFM